MTSLKDRMALALSPEHAFLASLGRARGFLLEEELRDDLPEEDDGIAVPVLDIQGIEVAEIVLPVVPEGGPLMAQLENGGVMDAELRQQLLAEIDALERRLLLGFVACLTHNEAMRVLCEESDTDDGLDRYGMLWELASKLTNGTAAAPSAVPLQEHNLTLFPKSERADFVRRLHAYLNTVEGSIAKPTQVAGDWQRYQDIRRQLVLGNLRLVAKWASRHKGRLEFRRAFLFGLSGFTKALDRFEIERGYMLSTYASWWIRQSVTRARADHQGAIRIPVHDHESLRRFRQTFSKHWKPGLKTSFVLSRVLAQSDNRDKDCRLAHWANTSREWNPGISLSAPLIDSQMLTLREMRAVETFLKGLLENLDSLGAAQRPGQTESKERQRDILKLRIGYGKPRAPTLEEVGKVYDLTRERIRQLEAKARDYLVDYRLAPMTSSLRHLLGGFYG